MWLCCAVFKKLIKRKQLPQEETELSMDVFIEINQNTPVYSKLPFLSRVKGTYIQLLLIGYASITVLTFKLINCVEINHLRYLYIQASVKCYQNWQITIFPVIVVWVVPFSLSLYFGCKLLQKCKIKPNGFSRWFYYRY